VLEVKNAVHVAMLLAAASAQLCAGQSLPADRLDYKRPAKRWIEALPIWKGRLGAMVFGVRITSGCS
jgi:hypothetical protein